ncbi:MAG: hypothetical protein EA397_00970 [Deltaproteobacteria bacterium]|nr:MAG: hypothetical protein EA397_00970 [Deltaproteobacteria bacterium]
MAGPFPSPTHGALVLALLLACGDAPTERQAPRPGMPTEDHGSSTEDASSHEPTSELPTDPPRWTTIDHPFLLHYLGGHDPEPTTFEDSVEGFQDYLDEVGIVFFSAHEYVTPHNPTVAASCGYDELLPPQSWWRRGAVLGLMADDLRELVGEPVYMRNWWRPPCYNQGVGGAAGGDHPDADAVDLDFRSERSRADAQAWLCEVYWQEDLDLSGYVFDEQVDPRLNLSIGLGGRTIHVGVLSTNGRRHWKYGSYVALSGSGSCW